MKSKIKIRRRWKINPKARVKESGKGYSRKAAKVQLKKEMRVYEDENKNRK